MAIRPGDDILPTDFSGMIVMFGGSTPPDEWLLCDGSAVSRSTYSVLFGLLGTTYGTGDGSTTFNLPDLRSSFPLGMGQRVRTFAFDGASAVDPSTDTITVPSNESLITGQAVALTGSSLPTGLSAQTYYVIRISATSVKLASSLANAQNGTAVDITADGSGTCTLTQTLTSRSIGATGGEEAHAMSSTELLAHTHAVNDVGVSGNTGTGSSGAASNKGDTVSESTGGNAAMNGMPPYTVVNFIIKT
jgi:microcystin-dependent protein